MMILALIFSILSYVIPSSSYQMTTIEYEAADGSMATREVIDPDTWALMEEDHAVSFMEYITSFIRGMEAVSGHHVLYLPLNGSILHRK